MDTKVMMSVLMSMIFFAPLLIALTFFLFVGVLVVFEGAVAFVGRHEQTSKTASEAPASTEVGPIVAGLEAAIQEEANLRNVTTKRTTGNK